MFVNPTVYFYHNCVHSVHHGGTSTYIEVPDDGRTDERSAIDLDLLPPRVVHEPDRRRRHACICWLLACSAPVSAAGSQHRHYAWNQLVSRMSFVEAETTKAQAVSNDKEKKTK